MNNKIEGDLWVVDLMLGITDEEIQEEYSKQRVDREEGAEPAPVIDFRRYIIPWQDDKEEAFAASPKDKRNIEFGEKIEIDPDSYVILDRLPVDEDLPKKDIGEVDRINVTFFDEGNGLERAKIIPDITQSLYGDEEEEVLELEVGQTNMVFHYVNAFLLMLSDGNVRLFELPKE